MHKPSLLHVVYAALYPKPRSTDPTSFAAHISKYLVPEVRFETTLFYGALDSIEARYPGLDYSYPPHRMRLSRFPYHRRLFRAFDELRLTPAEIESLCRWEGTRSARIRYERDAGIRVRDTTEDDIHMAPHPLPPSVSVHVYASAADMNDRTSIRLPIPGQPYLNNPEIDFNETAQEDDLEDENSSEDDMESYGVALNEHLLEATAARGRGVNVALDEIWEQWLKEATERGGYTDMIDAIREGRTLDFGVRYHQQPQQPHPSIPLPNDVPSVGILPPLMRLPPINLPNDDLLSSLIPISATDPALPPRPTTSHRRDFPF
ncbi:hypothetical protein FQN57_005391 [Myotisia sp. PD_48]|nr:hypothetical protein FQN57_005391 [Myotisia sp. PD_48]